MLYKYKNKISIRLTAAALILCLAGTDAALAAPALGSRYGASSAGPVDAQPLAWKVEPSAGWIDERHTASVDAPIVVLVQDAHANPSAQFNAARLIRSALDAAGSDLVLLEAGQGDLGLDAFRRTGTPLSRRASAADLVRKGRLQAAEYLQLTSEKNIRLRGAENRAAYERALAIYSSVLKLRPRALASVARMEQTLNALGPAAFGPTLEAFWKLRLDHSKGSLGSAEYADRLLAFLDRAGEGDFSYPNLKTLSKLRAKESGIRFRTVEDHLARLDAERSWEEMTGREIGRILKNKAERTTPRDRIEIQRFVRYRAELFKIDAQSVLREMGSAEDRLVHVLSASDPEAGRWMSAALSIEFIRRLISLETDSESVDRFLSGASDPVGEAASVLNRRILDLGRLEENVLFDDAELIRAVRLARDFYRLAARRDVFLAGQTVREMERQGVRSAVLVAGGYHASNLKKILASSGISYISVIPRSDASTDRARYEKLLMSSLSAIALYPAGARCAYSAETRQLLADSLKGPASADEALSRELRADDEVPASGARLSWTRVLTALLRVNLEIRAFLYRTGVLGLDRVVLAMDAYHRATGFVQPHSKAVNDLFRQEGPYLVGAPVNAVRKSQGVRYQPNLKEKKLLEGRAHNATRPECPLCPEKRGVGQWTLMTRGTGRWILTSNPFSLIPNGRRHIIFLSQIHEDMHASEISVKRMLAAARDLGRGYSVFQNARGAGATLPDHHHVQAFDLELPVFADRFHRMEMDRIVDRPRGWTAHRSELSVEAVGDYPGRPMILRSKDPAMIAAWADRMIHAMKLMDRPLDLAARWTPAAGYELCLLPFRHGKVPAEGAAASKSGSKTPMVDYAQVWTERNGLRGGAGAPQASGILVTTHRSDGDVLDAPVAADAAAVERVIEGLLIPSDILWREVSRMGMTGPIQVAELLGTAPRSAGARMSRNDVRAALKAYLGAVRSYPARSLLDIKDEWDRMMETFPEDQVWSTDGVITALYSHAVFETLKALHDDSVRWTAAGNVDLEKALRQAALVVSGRIARNRLPVKSQPDYYWALPEAARTEEWNVVGRYSDLVGRFQAEAERFFTGTVQLHRAHPIIRDQDQVLNDIRNFLKRRLDAQDEKELTAALGVNERTARNEWESIAFVLDSSPVHPGSSDFYSQTLFERHSDRVLNYLAQPVPGDAHGRIMMTLLVRQMILLKNAEYRIGEPMHAVRTFSDWEGLKRLLELESDLYGKVSTSEYLRRKAMLTSLASQLKSGAEAAVGRIHAAEVSDLAVFKLPALANAPMGRDAEFLYQAMISMMTGFWAHVKGVDDPDYLEIFLTHTQSRSAFERFLSFLKWSPPVPSSFLDEDVRALVSKGGERIICRVTKAPGELVELLLIWPKDEPGLLSDITGVLGARGLEIRNIIGRSVSGLPTDHFWLAGWPSDPAASAALSRDLEADFEALRSGRITYPELFEREGRAYHAVQRTTIRNTRETSVVKLPKRSKTPEWSLEAHSSGYSPDLFLHLVFRWLYKNDAMITGTADYRKERSGRISTGFSIVRQNGASFGEHEIDDLVRRLNVFLGHRTVEAWTFYPGLEQTAEKFLAEVPTNRKDRAYQDLLDRVWMEPQNSVGPLKMKEIDAKLRLLSWAQKEARVPGDIFGGLRDWLDRAADVFSRIEGMASDPDKARDSIRSFVLNYPFLLWARGTPEDLAKLAAARQEAVSSKKTVIVYRSVPDRAGERAVTAFLPTSETMPELMEFMSRSAQDLIGIRAFRAVNDVFGGVVVQIQCRTEREADLSAAAIENAARRSAVGPDSDADSAGSDPAAVFEWKKAPYISSTVLPPRNGGFAFRVHVNTEPAAGIEGRILLFIREVFPGLELARFESRSLSTGRQILLGIRMKDDRTEQDRRKDPGRNLGVEESELFLEALSAFLRVDHPRPAIDLPLFKKVTDARRRDTRKLHSEIISNYRRIAEAVVDAIISGDHPGIAVDAQSGTGKTTLTRFIIQSLRRRGYEPFVAHGDLLFRPMAERKQWKDGIIRANRGMSSSERVKRIDEATAVWRADLIPRFIDEVMDAVEQPSGRRDVPIPGGFGYVRDPSELDYAYFTSRHNLDLLAGQNGRADVPGLVLPVRAGQVVLFDGKYIQRYLLPGSGKKSHRILPVWLWKDSGKVERQFLERAARIKVPSGEDPKQAIEGEVTFFHQAIQPSWIDHERSVAPLVGGLRANLNSNDPWKWRLEPIPAKSASGARLAERSQLFVSADLGGVSRADAAAFAARLIRTRGGIENGPQRSVRILDPASPGSWNEVSRLTLEPNGAALWNGAPLEPAATLQDLPSPARAVSTSSEATQEFDLQRKAMDAVRMPVQGSDVSVPLVVHLAGFGRQGAARDARLLSFARDLVLESKNDPGFTVHLETDADGSFRSLLVREGFAGILSAGPIPADATHLITLGDLKGLRSRPEGLPGTFRAITVEDAVQDPDDDLSKAGRVQTEAVYAFRPLIRLARVLRGRSLSDLADDYRRMTGRSIPPAVLERLIAGDLDTAERWAFKPLRAVLAQALSLYASAARMASRSA
jgi:hypothetical protein